jgi:hypothetical protein
MKMFREKYKEENEFIQPSSDLIHTISVNMKKSMNNESQRNHHSMIYKTAAVFALIAIVFYVSLFEINPFENNIKSHVGQNVTGSKVPISKNSFFLVANAAEEPITGTPQPAVKKDIKLNAKVSAFDKVQYVEMTEKNGPICPVGIKCVGDNIEKLIFESDMPLSYIPATEEGERNIPHYEGKKIEISTLPMNKYVTFTLLGSVFIREINSDTKNLAIVTMPDGTFQEKTYSVNVTAIFKDGQEIMKTAEVFLNQNGNITITNP